MTFSAILFYILAAIVLYGAVRTVTAKNPVHAALHLVLTFCVSAMIWMLMQAEFLGVTLVVVYVGAAQRGARGAALGYRHENRTFFRWYEPGLRRP